MILSDPPAGGLRALLGDDEYHARHIGPSVTQEAAMLRALGFESRHALVRATVSAGILLEAPLALEEPATERRALAELRELAARNQVWRSYIGAGYHGTITPEPIRRNVLENPGWYTSYTPYQAEVSQGRLEALLNFQQMVIDLTGLPVANASLLDEATAAAEAMSMARRASKSKSNRYLLDAAVHPQVQAVVCTRAHWMGIEVVVAEAEAALAGDGAAGFFGAHLQTPDTFGRLRDFTAPIAALRAAGGRATVGCDPLAALLVKSPGAMGADIAIGSAQRFGIPLGYGGPHAAFMAAREDLLRTLPGRIIGVSKDAAGRPALRMALQTREQHIRRDKATSNICTSQALLANMAGFYAVYHGPQGLLRIALRVNAMARLLAHLLAPALAPLHASWFDTLVFDLGEGVADARRRAHAMRINLREYEAEGGPDGRVGAALDETVTPLDVAELAWVLGGRHIDPAALDGALAALGIEPDSIPPALRRADAVLTHPVFNRHHSETGLMRYLKRLENRDLSLVHSMIPLGSCTMKLNAASAMAPVTWPEFADLHPFAPREQAAGYAAMLARLGGWLAEITGFAAVSFQPNSGAQGEYAGLLAVRHYLAAQGQGHRDVCLVPASAHGTNPASAQMMGLRIVVVACDAQGNIDVADLAGKIAQHREAIAALMVTYPSTHGVFEASIVEVCRLVHEAGGQVYMDGANLNAQAGLTRPALIGADVCHLNLHKTFCIPHGGGGPGMGPIAVAAHLAPFLPAEPFPLPAPDAAARETARAAAAQAAVSAAPFGSALITTISWMYIRMMGAAGIRRATETAILNANYIAKRLSPYFPVLYRGQNDEVAHECILDMRHLKVEYGVSAEDVAKRLMDYGFHAPTLSFPVADTLMVEPTESESKDELDRFCEAMIAIHGELQRIASGALDREDNPLKGAPHTAAELAGEWPHRYTREEAVFPLPWVREAKFWPSVKRIDNAAGDRHLVCTCPPAADYADESGA
ncbi:MAG: aminomethyl-transferring glycine dehydrogenase [Burkholderiales bacterium]|nr:aminomethyl-transferring glycine dehydrogenase [Burkholderiales bacterium]OJX06735.1 MAG: glycine dehydrogenase (aminomethyl-transferring) [Burkholderiales bacterium 70-64]